MRIAIKPIENCKGCDARFGFGHPYNVLYEPFGGFFIKCPNCGACNRIEFEVLND